MPQWECVAGMETAVGELGYAVEREIVEVEQLPRSGEMEEPVSVDSRRDAPEEHAENDAGGERRPTARDLRRLGPVP